MPETTAINRVSAVTTGREPPDDDAPERRIFRPIDLIEQAADFLEARNAAAASGLPLGPQIAFSAKFSEIMGGFLAIGAHVLHGAPDAGKTALANVMAATAEVPALVVTVEHSPRELFVRQLARVANRPLSHFIPPTSMKRDEFVRIARAVAAQMPQLVYWDAYNCDAPFADIQQLVRDMKPASGAHMLLVVDSAQSWADRNGGSESDEYTRTTAAIKAFDVLAKREGIAALIISERNRSSNKSQPGTADAMYASKNTGAFEYRGRSVLSLDLCGDGSLDDAGRYTVDLHIVKNKDGLGGRKHVKLLFEPTFMRFSEQ